MAKTIKDALIGGNNKTILTKTGTEIGTTVSSGLINGLTKSQVGDRLSEIFLLSSQTGISQEDAAKSLGYDFVGLQNANNAFKQMSNSAADAGASVTVASKSFGDFFDASKNGTTVIGKLATALGMSSGALVGWGAAIAAAVAVAVIAWDYFHISVKEATEYLDDWNSKLDETKSKLNTQKDLVSEAKESYDKLAKGVNTVNNANINLSDEEYSEFIDLNNRLAEQFPELKKGIDNEGNAILNLGDSSESTAKQLDELISRQEKLANLEIANNLSDTFKNTMVLIDDNANKISKYEDKIKGLESTISDLDKLVNGTISDNISLNVTAGNNTELQNMYVDAIKKAGLYALGDDLFGFRENSKYFDEASGILGQEFYINVATLTPDQKKALSDAISDNAAFIKSNLIDSLDAVQTELESTQIVNDSYWQSFIGDNLIPAMHSKASYSALNESGRKMADAMVNGLSSEIVSQMDDEDPYAYIQKNIIPYINELNNMDFTSLTGESLTFMDLFSGELSNEELVNLYNQIQTFFNRKGVEISFTIGEEATDVDNEFDANNRAILGYNYPYDERGFKRNNTNSEEVEKINEATKDFTTEQKKEWNAITEGSKDADEALERWAKHLEEVEESTSQIAEDIFSMSDFSSMTDEISNLKSLYDKFRENLEDDPAHIALDISDVEGLRENWENIVGKENFDEFELKVTSDTTGVDEVKAAFTNMVTSYVNAELSAKGANEETINMIKSQLRIAGLTSESINDYVDWMEQYAAAEKIAADSGIDLANATEEDEAELMNLANNAGVSTKAMYALRLSMINTAYADGKMDFSTSISKIQELAKEAGLAVNEMVALQAALRFDAQIQNSVTLQDFYTGNQAAYDQAKQDYMTAAVSEFQNTLSDFKLDFSDIGSDAGDAGSDAGDAYVDAYEKELSRLEELESNGLITTKQKLDYQRGLYKKYFEGIEKYGEKFYEEQKKWLNAMVEYMEKVASAANTVLDAQISKLERAKSKAVKPIEKEIKAIDKEIDAIDDQIEELQDAKEAMDEYYDDLIDNIDDSIEALEDEKEARDKLYDDQIKAKEDIIEGYNDEIDKMEKINDERDRQLNLAKAMYDLEKASNQRNKLTYSAENGFTYQTDSNAISEARSAVENAKYEMAKAQIQDLIDAVQAEVDALEDAKEKLDEYYDEQIELLEKQKETLEKEKEAMDKIYDDQIKALEKQKEALEKQKEALEKQKEAIEEFYDEQIEFYQELKDTLQELLDVKELAEAEKTLREFGVAMEDVLSGNFINNFKGDWLGLISDVQGGSQDVIAALQLMGNEDISTQNIESFLGKTEEVYNKIADNIRGYGTKLDEANNATEQVLSALSGTCDTASDSVGKVADKVGEISDNAGTASTNVGTLATNTGTLGENASAAKDDVSDIATSTKELSDNAGTAGSGMQTMANALNSVDTEKTSTIATDLNSIAEAIERLSLALGVGTEGTVGSLSTALSTLQTTDISGLVGQFGDLADAAESVSSAIGGGGSTDEKSESQAGLMGSESGGKNNDSGSGIIGALTEMGTTATEVITGGGEGEDEGAGGVVGDFGKFEEAVNKVSSTIDGSGGDVEIAGGTLSDALDNLQKKDKDVTEDLVKDWKQWNLELQMAEEAINKMVEGLQSLLDSYETNLTVHLTIDGETNYTGTATRGNKKGHFGFNILEAIGLPGESSIGNASLGRAKLKGTAKISGNANMSGNWAYEGGSTLIGEIAPELVVFPDGHFETFGNNGPEMVNLPKGSVIFNHLQTGEILDGKNQVGRANMNGTIPDGLIPLSIANPERYKMLSSLQNTAIDLTSSLNNVYKSMNSIDRSLINSNAITNTTNNVPTINIGDVMLQCPGVTETEVVQSIQNQFAGLFVNAYQRSMRR